MASFTERISVIIDVTTNKAVSGLKDFRQAVGEAEGFTGKLKAGVGSLKGVFAGSVAGPLALGTAVATAGKFALDAVNDYAELGVQVGNFAEATGLATEDASRWIEVAGDLGISAGSLQNVFARLEKSISPKLFHDLGVEIARTSQGTVDANQTFLNVIDRLRQIEDPAQRAQMGAKLLGKGWQEVVPLIGQSAENIKSRLAGVADIKVFDRKKVEESKRFRDSFNDLKDAGEEFALTLGEAVIPEVTALAKAAIFVVQQLKDMKDALTANKGAESDVKTFQRLDDAYRQYGNTLFQTKAAQDANVTSLRDLKDASALNNEEGLRLVATILSQADALHAANAELAANATNSDNSARLAAALAIEQERVTENSWKASDSLKAARTELKKYQDQIKGRNDLVNLVASFDDMTNKLNGIIMLHEAGLISDRDYWMQTAQLTGDAQVAVSDYLDTVNELPPTTKKKLLFEFDPSNPTKFLNDFQAELDRRKVTIGVVPGYGTGPQDGPNTNPRKPAVPVAPGTGSGTGSGGSAHDAIQRTERFGMSTQNQPVPVNITVNVPPNANLVDIGRATADALAAFYRAGGERV
jgi:hypothetical protein